MNTVKVDILGSEYELRSPGGEEQVRRVAAHLNERLNEVLTTTNTSSTLAAAVLAALNITNDFLQLKESQEQLLQEIEGKLGGLLDKLEQSQD